MRTRIRITITLVMLMTVISSYSQINATIDGVYCSTAANCPKYVCEHMTISLTAGITSGVIDSLKWREKVSFDGGITWPSLWTTIGTTVQQTVPVSEPATVGHVYRYQLIVYQGGIAKFSLAEMYVNAGPAATLLCNDTTICTGTLVTFSASAGGTNYNFKVNGVTTYSGPSASDTSSTLVNGDSVTVTVTNGNCVTTSMPIIMVVHPKPIATSVTGNPTVGCVGQNGIVTVTGLTGTGPWTLDVWNTVGGIPSTLYHSVPGTINTPNTTFNMIIPSIGLTNMFLQVTDAYCSNH